MGACMMQVVVEAVVGAIALVLWSILMGYGFIIRVIL
jgi:hypothetical protein